MKKDAKEYLTLGEVAEILGINKTTLRHYNREGLIEFERDEENNYRYYHKNQIDNFRIILNFRKIGFSIEKIKEIKNYFKTKNYSKMIELISEKEREFQKEMEEIQKNMEILEEHKKYMIYLNEIIKIDPEYISEDAETKSFSRKDELIFTVKKINEQEYGILCAGKNFSDRKAVEYLYKEIENKGYVEDGDLEIEKVVPFGELSREKTKIKIFKIPIKPLTCQQVTGLE